MVILEVLRGSFMETLKTGTTIIGIKCKDAIVLAADKRMTLGGRIVSHREFDKIVQINDNIALCIAGGVADVQLLLKIIKAQLKLDELRNNKKLDVRSSANLLANLIYQNIRRFSAIPAITGFLLGGRDDDGIYLYNLGIDGALSEHNDYVADGSGFMFAIGVLESAYRKDMSMDDGVKLAVKSINAAIQRDTASGDGVDVVVVTKSGIKKVLTKKIEAKLSI